MTNPILPNLSSFQPNYTHSKLSFETKYPLLHFRPESNCGGKMTPFKDLIARAHEKGLDYIFGAFFPNGARDSSVRFYDGAWLHVNYRMLQDNNDKSKIYYFKRSLLDGQNDYIAKEKDFSKPARSATKTRLNRHFSALEGNLPACMDILLDEATKIINQWPKPMDEMLKMPQTFLQRLAFLDRSIPLNNREARAYLHFLRALCTGKIGFIPLKVPQRESVHDAMTCFSCKYQQCLYQVEQTDPQLITHQCHRSWEELLDPARENEGKSLFQLAVNFLEGKNCFPRDLDLGVGYLMKAAHLHYPEAMYTLGLRLLKESPNEKVDQAYFLIYQALTIRPQCVSDEDGQYLHQMACSSALFLDVILKNYHYLINTHQDQTAMFYMASLQNDCPILPQDVNCSLEWLEQAARFGHSKALFMLGNYYKNAVQGTERSKEIFHFYYKAAALQGLEDALIACHENGILTHLNFGQERYLDLLYEAAKNGSVKCFKLLKHYSESPKAFYYIGMCLMKGWGTEEGVDKPGAYAWLSKALTSHMKLASSAIAELLWRDDTLGSPAYRINSLKNAIADDVAFAHYALAKVYREQNIHLDLAIQLLRQAAEKGYTPASMDLWHLTHEEAYLLQALKAGDVNALYEQALQLINERPEQALNALLLAAHKDHAKALQLLGNLYYEGKCGLKKNLRIALTLYSKALALDNKAVLINLSKIYHQMSDFSNYFKCLYSSCKQMAHHESFVVLSSQVEQPIAQYYLGRCYESGHCTDKNPLLAQECYKQFLEMTNGQSTLLKRKATMGLLRLSLQNIPDGHIPPESLPYIETAAALSDKEALFLKGYCYQHGIHFSQSMDEALRYYKEAAGKSHYKSMYAIAQLLLECPHRSDHLTWKDWLHKAALGGYPRAMYHLGHILLNDSNVFVQMRAKSLFHRAAKAGLVKAMDALSECFRLGLGTPVAKDYAELWRQKALQLKGRTTSECRINDCLAVPTDPLPDTFSQPNGYLRQAPFPVQDAFARMTPSLSHDSLLEGPFATSFLDETRYTQDSHVGQFPM